MKARLWYQEKTNYAFLNSNEHSWDPHGAWMFPTPPLWIFGGKRYHNIINIQSLLPFKKQKQIFQKWFSFHKMEIVPKSLHSCIHETGMGKNYVNQFNCSKEPSVSFIMYMLLSLGTKRWSNYRTTMTCYIHTDNKHTNCTRFSSVLQIGLTGLLLCNALFITSSYHQMYLTITRVYFLKNTIILSF